MTISKTVIAGIGSAGIAVVFIMGGSLPAVAGNQAVAQHVATVGASQIELMHVHGLSYSADGKKIFIPSHNGLAVYSNGGWSKLAGPESDFMGFSATHNAFYSSGHPAAGSSEVNPFGVIKSKDGGKTWQKLGLAGEADFHTLATSFGTNVVYVMNHQPNTRMSDAGIYATDSDGMKWRKAAANGLGAKVNSLAVHPTDAKIVAAGAADGLYLSRDGGDHFERLAANKQVLAEWFDLSGDQLWFSSYAGKPMLSQINLKKGATAKNVPLSMAGDDAVAYIAQNPVNRDEIAIATFKRSVYVSKDRGRNWTQIATEGKAS
ncbi:MAG: F510_1955 family glycosylhydrolase [Herbaspirillum sp.]